MQAPTLYFTDNDGFLVLSRQAQPKPVLKIANNDNLETGASHTEQPTAPVEYMTDALGAVLTPLPDTMLPEHHRWRLVQGAWVATADHRGREGFLPDGTPHKIGTWGPLPEGWAKEKPYVAPTQKETEAQYTSAAQAYLDDFARTKTYDGILSACTYATSTSQRLREEGKLCVELRDAVWETAFTILNDVQAGKRPIPTIEQFIAELPKLTWG